MKFAETYSRIMEMLNRMAMYGCMIILFIFVMLVSGSLTITWGP